MTPNLRRKAPSDGGDLEVASDDAEDAPEAECIDDNDLHREPSAEFEDDAEDAPEAEYTDDEHDGAEHDEAEYIDVDDLPQFPPAQLLRQFPQISAELETIFSPDREADSFLFSGFPSWILLDPVSYIDGDLGCDNATTAEAQTISRREDGVKVSFFTAKPPYPSYFNIHIPSLMEKPYMLCGRPMILYTVRNMALINIIFGGYRRQTDYYLYRVIGPGRRPSLLHLEHVSQELKKVSHVVSVGFLPIDGDGGFTLAAIALEQAKEEQYGLHVFRFERGEWTSKVHVLERHQIGDIRLYNIEKVIPIADRELGFVDLWHGVIVFDLLQASPVPRYIPLPKVLPGNQSKDQLGLSAKCFRDVVFSTEGIKCVEVEMTWKQIVHEKPCTESDVWWESNIIFDSDLMQHETASSEDERVEGTFNYLGWRLICWSRKAGLAGWKKDCSICAKDIINKCELWGLNDLNDFYVSFPTLSVDGRQLFMISKENATDLQSCSRVIVIDLGKHVLQAFSQFPTRPDLFTQAFISCDIFKFLNMPPGETAGWEDDNLSGYSTSEVKEESGHTKLIRSSNHYPCTKFFICSAISNRYQIYGLTVLFQRLPLLQHENIISVRTSQSMEKPSEGAPVVQLDCNLFCRPRRNQANVFLLGHKVIRRQIYLPETSLYQKSQYFCYIANGNGGAPC